MPQPGQKTVTLPSDLVERVQAYVADGSHGYRSSADFVKQAFREKLDNPDRPSTPPRAVSPVPATAPGEPEDLDVHEPPVKIPRPRRQRDSGEWRAGVGHGTAVRSASQEVPVTKLETSAAANPVAGAISDTPGAARPAAGTALPSPPPAPVEPSRGPPPEPKVSLLAAGEAAVERPVGPSAEARRGGRSSRSSATGADPV